MSDNSRRYVLYHMGPPEPELINFARFCVSKTNDNYQLGEPLLTTNLNYKKLAEELMQKEKVERPFEVTTIWATIASSEGVEMRPFSDGELRRFTRHLKELVDSEQNKEA